MCPSVTACLFIQLELFFETLLSRLLWVCVPGSETSAPPPPPLFFQLFLGLTTIPGKTQACHRAATLVALAPPPPLYGLLFKFLSLFVYLFIYCMQILCGLCFCSLLFFFFFLSFLVTHCLLVHGCPSPTWRDISCNLAIP